MLSKGTGASKNLNFRKFVKMLMDNAATKGIKFTNQPIMRRSQNLREDDPKNVWSLRQTFSKEFISKNCQIVLVITPIKGSSIYSHVKQASELAYGNNDRTILTQCVVGKTVSKGQFATVQNILLKINSKLGGVNQVVMPSDDAKMLKVFNMLFCPILIIGADVTHPPPGSSITVRVDICVDNNNNKFFW